jgi:hypothetical protein
LKAQLVATMRRSQMIRQGQEAGTSKFLRLTLACLVCLGVIIGAVLLYQQLV